MTFRISPTLLECSIYFYPDDRAAREGDRVGGSGFMLGRPFPAYGDQQCTLWAVTNRHVIEQGNCSIRINTQDGGFDVIDTTEVHWIFHPDGDDLAISPLPTVPDKHIVTYVPPEMIQPRQTFEMYDIGPGDPCFLIGRFISQEGKQKNTPTVRFGQIAQSPADKIIIGRYSQESYLVEIRSIGGYSGSPVFVWLDNRYYRRGMQGIKDDRGITRDHTGNVLGVGHYPGGPWLLGVDWCNIHNWERVHDRAGQELPNGFQVHGNTGMTGVVPAWRLHWLLMECPATVALANHIESAALAAKAPDKRAPVGTSTQLDQ